MEKDAHGKNSHKFTLRMEYMHSDVNRMEHNAIVSVALIATNRIADASDTHDIA